MPNLSTNFAAGVVFFGLFAILAWPALTNAAILSLSPNAGTFNVDGTFNVSVFLNTEGSSINLFDVFLKFPPDKLQVVSPTVGKSIAGIWTTPPTVDNGNGIIHLQGGIPKGINTTGGLITAITFRVKRIGEAIIKFQDSSKILLNDGKGTDVLRDVVNAIYAFILPPPAGPYVFSATHPDQTKWYSAPNAVFSWPADSNISAYSYALSDNPAEIPDDISEGLKTSVGYSNLKSGTRYFHVKGRSGDSWGGTTHFAINIDHTPPAEFLVEVLPKPKTSSRNLVINFFSSDVDSGIDHYEYKLVPLTNPESASAQIITERFFIESTSPVAMTNLGIGSYDFIVRAYDKTVNFSDEKIRIEIQRTLFRLVTGQGLRIGEDFTIPWPALWLLGLAILILLLYSGYKFRSWHHGIIQNKTLGGIPREMQPLMDQLKRYRDKYGKILVLFLALGALLEFGQASNVLAETASLSAPYVVLAPTNITNNEVLYIAGKTTNTHETVVVYIQSEQTGETYIERVVSDNKGDWFYSHSGFLRAGRYTMWVKSELNGVESPPSPRFDVAISPQALQFGASRISKEALYLFVLTLFLILIAGLISYNIFHFIQGRKKRRLFLDHIKQTESAIMRGFAVLKKDIASELEVLRKNRVSGEPTMEEKQKEAELLRDFDWIEKMVGKEIWEMKVGEHDLSA